MPYSEAFSSYFRILSLKRIVQFRSYIIRLFFFFFLKFIYFWLCWIFVALCGLPPVVVSRGSLRCGAWTSLLAEHRLLARGRQRLHLEGSRAQASLLHGTWNLPAPGISVPPRHSHGDLSSLAPHERLPELPVIPREKSHTGSPAPENPRDASVIAR